MFALVDGLGFGAGVATLATFAQRRMLPMRFSALAANVLFISYGVLGPYYPVLCLHALLLPLNLWRLVPVLPSRPLRRAEATLLHQWRRNNHSAPMVTENA